MPRLKFQKSAQILGQDLVVLAVGLDVGKACIEQVDELLLVGAEHSEAVGGTLVLRALNDLQGNTALDGVGHNGGVLKACVSLSVEHRLDKAVAPVSELKREEGTVAVQQQFDFELQRAEKAADLDLSQQEKKFDFDLDQKRRDADEERNLRRDEQQQAMTDRNVQRNREQQQFDFDMKRAEKTAEMEDKQREKKFDFDLEVQKQEKADEHVLRMEEHEMKMAKGNIAMQNMQTMMDAKRAAQQDEFEAEERRMQTQKEMSAEQIMAAQIREMDAEAQAKFAESFSAGKDTAREREMAEEKAQIYEKMMGQMVDMAKTGMQANADIASGRIVEEHHRGEESPATESPSPIPLNTLWLREHGFEGSFNELAGYLHSLGADISQDYDNQGNPIIVVQGINHAKVMEVLEKAGVKF